MRYFLIQLIICSSLFFIGCEAELPVEEELFTYAHFSHIRTRSETYQDIDARIKRINFNQFDLTLLGGDLCEDTSKEFETLVRLDSIFDFKSQSVLWAMGNHDNTNIEHVKKITQKEVDYVVFENGIVFIVLDTHGEEDTDLNVTEEQISLVKSVTDTISSASHLIIMTHNLNWVNGHPEMREHCGKGVNDHYGWSTNFAVDYNNWHYEITPLLQRTQRKGVQVICLAGDIGNNVKSFEEHSADRIIYLASGINPVDDGVKFLLFKHVPPNLYWEFVELDKYLAAGQKWEVKTNG